MNERKAETLCKVLTQDGMKPYQFGKDADGKLFEYVSFPWVAGADIFVMVRKPNAPATLDCVDALEVLPTNSRAALRQYPFSIPQEKS